MPTDNNGILLQMPAVPETCGAASATGYLLLGIGTESNNSPTGLAAYPTGSNPAAVSYGDFLTTFSAYSAGSMIGFIDSGSSSLFIPPPVSGVLPDCSSAWGQPYTGIYCPTSNTTLNAVNQGYAGSQTGTASFQVGDGYYLLTSGNMVLSNLASESGTGSSAFFDWGLPFFYGRTVAIGINGKPAAGALSSLGTALISHTDPSL